MQFYEWLVLAGVSVPFWTMAFIGVLVVIRRRKRYARAIERGDS